MTVPVWPSEMGQWMRAPGFSTKPRDGRLRTPTDSGPGKSRRRFSSAVKPVSGVLRCSLSQLARLEQFWDEDTQGGTLPFAFPDQVYNDAVLLNDDGSPLTTEDDEVLGIEGWWLVKFVDYDAQPIRSAGAWDVAIRLEVMP